MNNYKNRDASQIIADFLQQDKNAIACVELTGGSEEGTIFKCGHNNANYVIKFFAYKEVGSNEVAWTKHASELGVGCKFFYTDPNGAYMITALAKGTSLLPDMINSYEVIKAIALNLAKLHASSAPFAQASDMFIRMEAKYNKLQCSGALKEKLEQAWDRTKTIINQISVYAISLVPCHNDLNWGNIFWDKEKVTFIDWADAALGNPYFDIAAFFILNNVSLENEQLFFKSYPNKRLITHLSEYMHALKQLVYFEFALNVLGGVQAGKKELLSASPLPPVKPLPYYLTLLAKKEVKVDSEFLYEMALASLTLL